MISSALTRLVKHLTLICRQLALMWYRW